MRLHSNVRANRRAKGRGTTAVEFAVLAPIFFMLVFGILEFSRFMMIRNTASNAAYEAARVAMSYGASAQNGIDEAALVMQSIGAQNVTTTINPAIIMDDTPEVTVTVQIPFNDNAYLPPMFAAGSVISGTCTLATEGYRASR